MLGMAPVQKKVAGIIILKIRAELEKIGEEIIVLGMVGDAWRKGAGIIGQIQLVVLIVIVHGKLLLVLAGIGDGVKKDHAGIGIIQMQVLVQIIAIICLASGITRVLGGVWDLGKIIAGSMMHGRVEMKLFVILIMKAGKIVLGNL